MYLTLFKLGQKGEHMNWFLDLEEEEQEFLKRFILASGSLKQLAKDYEVSYPTVRIRVDKIIQKIKLKNYNQDSFIVSMGNLLELLLVVAIIAFQTFCGYIGNKYLGMVLPLTFIGFVLFFLSQGALGFNFKDIIMPFFGPLILAFIYDGGKQTRKKKIKKELDKMKAKDITQNKKDI